jgi:hypothetical protein
MCDAVYTPGSQVQGSNLFLNGSDIGEFVTSWIPTQPTTIYSGENDLSPSAFFHLDDPIVQRFLDNDFVVAWHAENNLWIHPKMKHARLATSNSDTNVTWLINNQDRLKEVPKRPDVFMDGISINTNEYERIDMLSLFRGRAEHGVVLPHDQYMERMAQHKYVLCPMGHGMDTHRFWEAQTCGCIPIIRCPPEFLPTYEGTRFICLAGTCYPCIGVTSIIRVSHFKETVS